MSSAKKSSSSSESKKKSVTTQLQAVPHSLYFPGPYTRRINNTVTLTNQGKATVLFKMKAVVPDRYRVLPKAGYIPPGESMELLFILLPFDNEKNEASKYHDGFSVAFAELGVSTGIPETPAKEMWLNKEVKKLPVLFGPYLACHFISEAEVPSFVRVSHEEVSITKKRHSTPTNGRDSSETKASAKVNSTGRVSQLHSPPEKLDVTPPPVVHHQSSPPTKIQVPASAQKVTVPSPSPAKQQPARTAARSVSPPSVSSNVKQHVARSKSPTHNREEAIRSSSAPRRSSVDKKMQQRSTPPPAHHPIHTHTPATSNAKRSITPQKRRNSLPPNTEKKQTQKEHDHAATAEVSHYKRQSDSSVDVSVTCFLALLMVVACALIGYGGATPNWVTMEHLDVRRLRQIIYTAYLDASGTSMTSDPRTGVSASSSESVQVGLFTICENSKRCKAKTYSPINAELAANAFAVSTDVLLNHVLTSSSCGKTEFALEMRDMVSVATFAVVFLLHLCLVYPAVSLVAGDPKQDVTEEEEPKRNKTGGDGRSRFTADRAVQWNGKVRTYRNAIFVLTLLNAIFCTTGMALFHDTYSNFIHCQTGYCAYVSNLLEAASATVGAVKIDSGSTFTCEYGRSYLVIIFALISCVLQWVLACVLMFRSWMSVSSYTFVKVEKETCKVPMEVAAADDTEPPAWFKAYQLSVSPPRMSHPEIDEDFRPPSSSKRPRQSSIASSTGSAGNFDHVHEQLLPERPKEAELVNKTRRSTQIYQPGGGGEQNNTHVVFIDKEEGEKASAQKCEHQHEIMMKEQQFFSDLRSALFALQEKEWIHRLQLSVRQHFAFRSKIKFLHQWWVKAHSLLHLSHRILHSYFLPIFALEEYEIETRNESVYMPYVLHLLQLRGDALQNGLTPRIGKTVSEILHELQLSPLPPQQPNARTFPAHSLSPLPLASTTVHSRHPTESSMSLSKSPSHQHEQLAAKHFHKKTSMASSHRHGSTSKSREDDEVSVSSSSGNSQRKNWSPSWGGHRHHHPHEESPDHRHQEEWKGPPQQEEMLMKPHHLDFYPREHRRSPYQKRHDEDQHKDYYHDPMVHDDGFLHRHHTSTTTLAPTSVKSTFSPSKPWTAERELFSYPSMLDEESQLPSAAVTKSFAATTDKPTSRSYPDNYHSTFTKKEDKKDAPPKPYSYSSGVHTPPSTAVTTTASSTLYNPPSTSLTGATRHSPSPSSYVLPTRPAPSPPVKSFDNTSYSPMFAQQETRTPVVEVSPRHVPQYRQFQSVGDLQSYLAQQREKQRMLSGGKYFRSPSKTAY